jgi:hypothetical protein
VRRCLIPTAGLVALLACTGESQTTPTGDETVDRGPAPNIEPASPALRRLTHSQYENAVGDLFGIDLYVPSNLEPDNEVEGLLSVGASTTSVSAYGVELYEDAAFLIADQVVESPDGWALIVQCVATEPTCGAEVMYEVAHRAWRRPITDNELDRLTNVVTTITADSGDFAVGVTYGLATILQSPHFLYRVEHGDGDGAVRPLTEWEIASRLSFLLWNSVPDQELLDAATAGELLDDAGLETQARRMLSDDRARNGIRNLFTEVYHLYTLDSLNKDPNVFQHASPELGPAAREETLLVLEEIILDDDADFRDLFTSQRTWIDRRLAALYSVPAPAEDGFAPTDLPEDGGRRGLLGHASFLLTHSHPTSTSATKRGKFIRTTILCQDIPAPPADVDTSIPEADATSPTLRERLQTHLEDPTCAGCHQLTDPIGLGFENFDGLARWRDTENGAVIDSTGELDGRSFNDAWQIGQVVSDHPHLSRCMTRHLYRYTTGRLEGDSEDALLDWLALGFEDNDFGFQDLLVDTILSDGFRTVGELQ